MLARVASCRYSSVQLGRSSVWSSCRHTEDAISGLLPALTSELRANPQMILSSSWQAGVNLVPPSWPRWPDQRTSCEGATVTNHAPAQVDLASHPRWLSALIPISIRLTLSFSEPSRFQMYHRQDVTRTELPLKHGSASERLLIWFQRL